MPSLPTHSDRSPANVPREVPAFARQFVRSLRRRDLNDTAALSGGSYADRHMQETGHEFERGCCARPENRCPNCRILLPLQAKAKGERYCSRACREAHQEP
jgi:hypothetical protein